MDPASIVAAATTAANGAWEIYSFCNDAKHINEAVRSLAKEAQAIRDVCEIVAKRLGSIVEEKDATELPGDKMRDLLGSQISDCQSTIAQIHASLQGLDKGSLNFLEKMKNQLRLNARAAGIAEARRQLRSYTDNLHLVLQVLSIEVSYLVPRKADQYLCTLIANAEHQMALLRAAQPQEEEAKSSMQNNLLAYSKEAITSADDLYRESQTNGSIGPLPTEERIREIEGWAQDVSEFERPSNINASELSLSSGSQTLVDEEKRAKRVKSSLPDVSLSIELASLALHEAGSAHQRGDFKECMLHFSERSEFVSALPEDEAIHCNNHESEFRMKLALESLQSSRDAFTKIGWDSVEQHLHEAVELVKPLAVDLQKKYSVQEWQVRTDLAKLSLESAASFFASDNFELTQTYLRNFEKLRQPLSTELFEELEQDECSKRMEIAQNALLRAKVAFEGDEVEKCWRILDARTEIVKFLPETEKTTCKDEECNSFNVFAHIILARAESSIAAEDFDQCLCHLQLHDTILEKITIEKADDSMALRPKYFRATCVFSTASSESRDGAITTLLEAIDAYEDRMSNLSERLELDLHVMYYMLSRLYLRAHDLDEAYDYCSLALKGVRRILGAIDARAAEYHALMVRILELQGEHRKARYYKALIPEAYLEKPSVKDILCFEVDQVLTGERAASWHSEAKSSQSDHAADFKRVSFGWQKIGSEEAVNIPLQSQQSQMSSKQPRRAVSEVSVRAKSNAQESLSTRSAVSPGCKSTIDLNIKPVYGDDVKNDSRANGSDNLSGQVFQCDKRPDPSPTIDAGRGRISLNPTSVVPVEPATVPDPAKPRSSRPTNQRALLSPGSHPEQLPVMPRFNTVRDKQPKMQDTTAVKRPNNREKKILGNAARFPTKGPAAPFKYTPPPIKTPNGIIFHCESGCLEIAKKMDLPTSFSGTKDAKLKGRNLATKYWNELVELGKPGKQAQLAWYFAKHKSGKDQYNYTPKIDLFVNNSANPTSPLTKLLSVSPGHVRILSNECIQWAAIHGDESKDNVLKKIDSSVSGGIFKKSRIVIITRIELTSGW